MVYGTILSRKHFKIKNTPSAKSLSEIKISILKPLKGVDADIQENLESFFLLEHPEFEILFSVADPADPVREVVEKLMAKYSGVNARLMVSTVDVGPNPKVNNMITSYSKSNYDWILISDSNVRVSCDYLKNIVAHLKPDTGLVTAVVSGQFAQSFGGALETIYLNTFYARMMLVAENFGRSVVVGKCMFFKKTTVARFGGIQILARYLAEDYMAGVAMEQLGLRVEIMNEPVVQIIGKYSLKDFWQRHLRWGRIRKAQAPLAFIFEPLSTCFISGLLGLGVFIRMELPILQFVLIHFGIWIVCDFILMHQLKTKLRPVLVLQWLARELLAVPHWLHIASGNTVNWRGTRLKLESGGTIT